MDDRKTTTTAGNVFADSDPLSAEWLQLRADLQRFLRRWLDAVVCQPRFQTDATLCAQYGLVRDVLSGEETLTAIIGVVNQLASDNTTLTDPAAAVRAIIHTNEPPTVAILVPPDCV